MSMADRLKQGIPCLVQGEGIANFVFVDDVVEAVLLALEIDNPNGRAFVINNDREVILWKEHVSSLSDLTGCPPVVLPAGNLPMLRLRKSLSMFGDSVVALRDTLGSREMLSLLSRIPLAVALGSRIFRGQRRKKIEQRMLSSSESKQPLKPGALLTKYETMSNALYENLTCHTAFSSSYAKSTLGWEPRTMYQEGWRISREWAKWAGLGSETQE
jgi:nucleoside-diphosphate-sugar epimerase